MVKIYSRFDGLDAVIFRVKQSKKTLKRTYNQPLKRQLLLTCQNGVTTKMTSIFNCQLLAKKKNTPLHRVIYLVILFVFSFVLSFLNLFLFLFVIYLFIYLFIYFLNRNKNFQCFCSIHHFCET